MSLYVPGNTWGFVWDSVTTGSAPVTTNFGVAFTAHASADTKGTWVNISTTDLGGGSVTTLARDVWLMELFVANTGTAATAKSALLDVGFDPAGGTTYQILVSNLSIGQLAAGNGGPARFRFPLKIPAGSTVAVRSASSAGGTSGRAWAFYWGAPSKPEGVYAGNRCHTVGVADDGSVPANSEGAAFTPGNTGTWGSWASLGTTTAPASHWNLSVQTRNATMAALGYYFELGVGDATTPNAIVHKAYVQTDTSERCYWMLPQYGQYDVPVGATLYVRGTCSGTTDTGWTAAAHGV